MLPMGRTASIANLSLSLLLSVTTAALAEGDCPLRWTDVAARAGTHFEHETGARGDKHLPETMGAGVAWLDFDGDGWLDLYAVQSGPYPGDGSSGARNALWRGLGDGRFVRVAGAGGADDPGYGQGVVVADADGDGFPDLFVANDGPDAFLRNQGNGTFAEATVSVFGSGTLGGWSSSAAFGDLDHDGDLDLYIARYLQYDPSHDRFCGDFDRGERAYCGPELFAGAPDAVWRNAGKGRFEEATQVLGSAGATGKGLGALVVDLDADGQTEIYVANDQTVNLLFQGQPSGRFEDVSFLSGAGVNQQGQPEAGMGVAVGDVDGDGLPDLAVTNFDVETNTLYRNLGDLQFDDASVASGFGQPSFNRLGFGLVLADFDLDGALDAYVANGHVRVKPRREQVTHAQPDLVLLGDGGGRFRSAECALAGLPALVGRGLAWADYDADGDPDLALSNSGGPLQLLRNDTLEANGAKGKNSGKPWLGVRLVGRGANTQAVGAVVRVRDRGGRSQSRWITAGDSYQSSSAKHALFGLAAEPTELEVVWPSGAKTLLRAPPVRQYVTLHEPVSHASAASAQSEPVR